MAVTDSHGELIAFARSGQRTAAFCPKWSILSRLRESERRRRAPPKPFPRAVGTKPSTSCCTFKRLIYNYNKLRSRLFRSGLSLTCSSHKGKIPFLFWRPRTHLRTEHKPYPHFDLQISSRLVVLYATVLAEAGLTHDSLLKHAIPGVSVGILQPFALAR